VLVLTVAVPQIDNTNADRLTAALEEAASTIPQPRVVLNLERVGYLSSAALGLFIAYQQKLAREGGKLRLCGLQPNIAQVFRVTKLLRAFDIRPDLTSALEAF
jgi:anti-sigma B factor antagonist